MNDIEALLAAKVACIVYREPPVYLLKGEIVSQEVFEETYPSMKDWASKERAKMVEKMAN